RESWRQSCTDPVIPGLPPGVSPASNHLQGPSMRPHAVLLMVLCAAPAPAAAQRPPVVTADDYARAERFLGYNTMPLVFGVGTRRWTCDLPATRCTGAPRKEPPRNAVFSPDSTRAAFIRDNNLWVREVASGRETQVTTDGAKDFGYATDNAGWIRSDRPVVLWSSDSKKIATFQQDERGVGEMYLVQSRVGHPVLEQWKY